MDINHKYSHTYIHTCPCPNLYITNAYTCGLKGAQFFLESMDSNLYENRSAMLIDTFSADLDVSAGTSLGPTVYRGRFQLAQIELSFEVACIGNYTYSNCTTSEPPTNKPQTEPGE